MQTATKLYKLRQETDDDNLWLLQALEILKGKNTKEVMTDYLEIKSGKVSIIEVKSSIELDNKQKEKIENKIKQQFSDKDIVFYYSISKSVENGLEIKTGDNIIELT